MNREFFDRLFGSVYVVQNRDELFALINFVEELKPEIILEIGVEGGGSMYFWLEILKKGGTAIGIDSRNMGGEGNAELMLNPVASKKGINLHLVSGKSEDPKTVNRVEEILNGRKVDFLFIDTVHEVEQVKWEFEGYSPFVRSGGIIGFHDLHFLKEYFNPLQGKRKVELNIATGTGLLWKHEIHTEAFDSKSGISIEAHEILTSKPEHNYTKFYKLKSGDVFVEGGSYVGRYANIASKKVGEKGLVIAIEPSPINFHILEKTTKKLKNVTLIQKALWNKNEKVYFMINPSNPVRNLAGHRVLKASRYGEWGKLTKHHIKNGKKKILVEADTLDNILGGLKISSVDLLAWDIEGSEVNALKGARISLKNGVIKNVALSFYHKSKKAQENACKTLQKYGYNIIEHHTGIIYGERRI